MKTESSKYGSTDVPFKSESKLVTSSGVEPEGLAVVDLGISEEWPLGRDARSDHWSFGILMLSASRNVSNVSQLSDMVGGLWHERPHALIRRHRCTRRVKVPWSSQRETRCRANAGGGHELRRI
jgi:hypothetical protein